MVTISQSVPTRMGIPQVPTPEDTTTWGAVGILPIIAVIHRIHPSGHQIGREDLPLMRVAAEDQIGLPIVFPDMHRIVIQHHHRQRLVLPVENIRKRPALPLPDEARRQQKQQDTDGDRHRPKPQRGKKRGQAAKQPVGQIPAGSGQQKTQNQKHTDAFHR